MRTKITSKTLTDLFKERIVELQEEPEFQWSGERINMLQIIMENPLLR